MPGHFWTFPGHFFMPEIKHCYLKINQLIGLGLGLGLETLTLKSFSSSCLSPLQTRSHSKTPSSMKKELSNRIQGAKIRQNW